MQLPSEEDLQNLMHATPEQWVHASKLMDILDRDNCERSLANFAARAWKTFDSAKFIDNWHIDVICEHLEAVNNGEIKRLIINIPPRHMKSSLVSVIWPAWTWALDPDEEEYPLRGPNVKWMFTSYADKLALRDAGKCRRLLQSAWYQKLWGDKFQIRADEQSKERLANTFGGERFSTSIGGRTMGEGGDIIVLDDPHKVKGVESNTQRENVISFFHEALQTRLNNYNTGAIVVIMQRLHEADLCGHILAEGGYEHLMLPARYDPKRICVTSLGLADPREDEGELLYPQRFPESSLQVLEKNLGTYAASAQLQQMPVPRGGGIIKRESWQLWGNPGNPDDPKYKSFPPMLTVIASLDGAYTEEKANDYSALTVWGVWLDENELPRLMLMAAWHDRLALNPLVLKVALTCKRFKVDRLLIENKASGKSVDQELKRLFAGELWVTQLINPIGDKVARAWSVQHLWDKGVIYAPDRAWADLVIDECANLPKGAHDDLADSAIQAVRYLRDTGWAIRSDENDRALLESATKPTNPTEPLYDV